MVELIVETEIL